MKSTTRYDQRVQGKIPPFQQDDHLDAAIDSRFVADAGGARYAHIVRPAASVHYSSDKPAHAAPQTKWQLNTKNNSFIGRSQHWNGPPKLAQNITVVPPPPFP